LASSRPLQSIQSNLSESRILTSLFSFFFMIFSHYSMISCLTDDILDPIWLSKQINTQVSVELSTTFPKDFYESSFKNLASPIFFRSKGTMNSTSGSRFCWNLAISSFKHKIAFFATPDLKEDTCFKIQETERESFFGSFEKREWWWFTIDLNWLHESN